ncbi:hypothetical protein [Poriferisphaera sp. WC338]|uniref:hypothetical protein n=1 Tax=Poriferisphaera sp. WC338 TaxID=3425129 RepID=UPI003D81A306
MSSTYPKGRSNPQHQLDPAQTQGMIAELNATLERAREERFRLIRTVKDCESRAAMTGANPAADGVAKLAVRINQLDTAIDKRFATLAQSESREDKRIAQLSRLERSIGKMAERIQQQFEAAQNIDKDVSRINKHLHAAADSALGSAKSKLDKLNQRIDTRLSQLKETEQTLTDNITSLSAEIQEAATAVDTHLDQALTKAREEAEKLSAPLAKKLDEQFQSYASRLDPMFDGVKAELEKIFDASKLDADETMRPVYEKLQAAYDHVDGHAKQIVDNFTEEINQCFNQKFNQHNQAFTSKSAHLEEQIKQHAETFGSQLTSMHEQLTQLADEKHSMLKDHIVKNEKLIAERVDSNTAGKLDDLARNIESRIADSKKQLEAHFKSAQRNYFADVDQKLDQMKVRADEHAAEVSANLENDIDTTMQNANQRATSVITRFNQTFDNRFSEANSKINGVDEKLKTKLQSHIDSYIQQADEFEQPYQHHLDQMLARAEYTLSQRVDAVVKQFNDRAEKIISPITEQLATQIASFHKLTDENASAAETRLRNKLTEQQESVRAMTQLLEKQVTRKMQSIKPQANQQLDETESIVRDRMTQMQSGAQSMMDMVERQLGKRISSIEPRITAAVQAAEEMLRTQLDALQSEIDASVAPLRAQVTGHSQQLALDMTELHHKFDLESPSASDMDQPQLSLASDDDDSTSETAEPSAHIAEIDADLAGEGLAARIQRIVTVIDHETPAEQIVVQTPGTHTSETTDRVSEAESISNTSSDDVSDNNATVSDFFHDDQPVDLTDAADETIAEADQSSDTDEQNDSDIQEAA